MFPEMRRKKQQLSPGECQAILDRGTAGTLALCGDEGWPYAVPISYVQQGDRIYFHCAKAGHKLNLLHQNPKASFCVVDQDHIVPQEYTTYFRSVILFGRVRELTGEEEKRAAMEALALRYHPTDTPAGRAAAIDKDWAPLCVLEMTVDHMTGKESIELTRQRPS